jgi:hypothetical protein
VQYRFSDLQITAPRTEIECILGRRSARSFNGEPFKEETSKLFLEQISQAPAGVEVFTLMLKNGSMKEGICNASGEITDAVDTGMVSHLMVDQHFLKQASMIVVFTSAHFLPEPLINAGAFAHHLYLFAESVGAGFSGIGAFYDKKLQNFLQTENKILYVCALGGTA